MTKLPANQSRKPPVPDDDNSLAGWFSDQQARIASCYLSSGNNQYQQSGWGGTPEHWKTARLVVLDGVTRDGDFLDIGCANGLLLESLIEWGSERNLIITPHGIDFVAGLVKLAKLRFPEHDTHFTVANAFDWQPNRRYSYVHTLLEYVPQELQQEYLQRLLDDVVDTGGRLIVSSYGHRGNNIRPVDVDLHLQMLGFRTAGCGNGRLDDGWVATRSAWIDR
jgi:2-polyprenyl-3-methyl-5-hydroxy-6-metoxy-1,4-benzoquinol methylase